MPSGGQSLPKSTKKAKGLDKGEDEFGEEELLGGDQGAPPEDDFGEEELLGGDQALPDAEGDSFDEDSILQLPRLSPSSVRHGSKYRWEVQGWKECDGEGQGEG